MHCADCNAHDECWPGESERRVAALVTREAVYASGHHLWRQGDTFGGFFLLTEGCVRLAAISSDGSERVLGFAWPHDLVGYEGLASGVHGCGARCLGVTRVCRLQWDPHEESDYASALAPALIRRLASTAGQALHRAPAEENALRAIERFLEHVARHIGRREGGSIIFDLPMSRADIGNHLGLAEETVTRVLRRFVAERGVVVAGRRFSWPLSDDVGCGSIFRSAAPSRISPV